VHGGKAYCRKKRKQERKSRSPHISRPKTFPCPPMLSHCVCHTGYRPAATGLPHLPTAWSKRRAAACARIGATDRDVTEERTIKAPNRDALGCFGFIAGTRLVVLGAA